MSEIKIDEGYSQKYSEKEPAPKWAQKYKWIQLLALCVIAAGMFTINPDSPTSSLLPALYGVMILIFLSVCIFCFPDSYKSKTIGLFVVLNVVQVGLSIYSLIVTFEHYNTNLIPYIVASAGIILLCITIVGLAMGFRRK